MLGTSLGRKRQHRDPRRLIQQRHGAARRSNCDVRKLTGIRLGIDRAIGKNERSRPMFLRSSVIGDLIGLLPGAGATIASFVSYGVEAKFGKRKHLMGTGIAEGIVAPQSAATASVGGAM